MRGSPFSFSNFSRGLNVLDSPYTLTGGEAIDVLNMVSSPRGAIRKRYGSTVFASASAASFVDLAVTDNFNRVAENPLSNGAKWTLLPEQTTKGKTNGTQYEASAAKESSGAYWNVAEQKDPAVSINVASVTVEAQTDLLACVSAGANLNGYALTITNENFASRWKLRLLKFVGGVTTVLETTFVSAPEAATSFGISVKSGVVVGWYKRPAGSWTRAFEKADSTYTKGYGGISTLEGVLDNFAIGELGVAPVTGIFTSLLPCNISGTKYMIAVAGKKIYSITSNGEITDITDAKSVTEGVRWSIVQSTSGSPNRVTADGPIYLSNGTDAPRYWTGATKETAVAEWTSKPEGAFVAVPKAKYLTYLGNRIWASGISGDTSAVRFSGFAAKTEEGEQADPTNWPKENIVWFEKEDGEEITGTGIAGSYLLVFKPHQTWVIFDLNEGENRKISDRVGCISFRSIVESTQGTFFLTPDQGVFVTNGATMREVSRNVRPILLGTDSNQARAAKLNELKNASAEFLNGHYYLSYMAQDESMKTLDYDTALQSWWLHDLAGNQWVHWEPTTGEPFLYTIPNKEKTGIIKAFVPGIYTDSGAVYTGAKSLACYWVSPWEPFFQYIMRHRINQPQLKKRIKSLFVDGAGELIVKVGKKFGSTYEELKGIVDNADGSEPKSPVALGSGETPTKAARYYSLGVSRVWSFLFGNNSAEPLEVDAYACDLIFRKS